MEQTLIVQNSILLSPEAKCILAVHLILAVKRIATSYTGRQADRNYQFPVDRVCPTRNRDSRSGIRTSSRVHDTKAMHTWPAIVSSPAPISLPLRSVDVKGSVNDRRVPDRAEITAEESATSLSSRSSFIYPSLVLFLRGYSRGDSSILI